MKREIIFTWLSLSTAICSAEEYPDILLIQTDEHNLKTLGCYRQYLDANQQNIWGKGVQVETPNIDKIAANGILFTNCYATTPVSSPSRASMITGLYPQNNDVVTNDIPINEHVKTVAEILRENGYRTGFYGKLHLNGSGKPEWNPSRDFGFTHNDFMYNRGHNKYITWNNGKPQFAPSQANNLPDSLFTTDFLTTRAKEFIEEESDQPYFCYLSFPDPHGPNKVRKPYDGMYDEMKFEYPASASKEKSKLPLWNYGNAKMENMSNYFGMIKCLDDNIGRLISAIPADRLDKTIIIFTSDHGDLCGEHGLVNKGVPMDGSAKVPFIISYPSKLKKAKKQDNVLGLIDLTPTLLSIVGIENDTHFEGRNVAKLMTHGKLKKGQEDAVYMRGVSSRSKKVAMKSSWLSVATSNYKLTVSESVNDKPWLVNLKADPNELINIFDDSRYLTIREALKKNLLNYCNQFNEPRLKNKKIYDELQKNI